MKYLLGLLIPFYALDQLTKYWVTQRIPFGGGAVIFPGFFELVHWGNTGAAFSMMQGQGWFFMILAFAALGVLGWMARTGKIQDTLSKIAFSLMAAGILGNLTDRLARGHVVDFLLFDLHVRFANPWPAFNVADSCICVAAVLLIQQSFRSEKQVKK